MAIFGDIQVICILSDEGMGVKRQENWVDNTAKIKYLKSVVTLFSKKTAMGPLLGISNEIQINLNGKNLWLREGFHFV